MRGANIVKPNLTVLDPGQIKQVHDYSLQILATTGVRIDHAYELRRKADGQIIAEGETTLACVDSEGKIRPLPDTLRE